MTSACPPRLQGGWAFLQSMHTEPEFPRWIANLMTYFGDSAITINAIPSSSRFQLISPGG